MQSLVPKPPGGMFCLFVSGGKKETQSLEILLAQVFLNIQVILVILCTAEGPSDFSCGYINIIYRNMHIHMFNLYMCIHILELYQSQFNVLSKYGP